MEKIPFVDLKPQYLALKEQIDRRIETVLNHGLFILGPEVEESEKAMAQYTGNKYCITCASGTDALLISLMAMDLQPGDEVITTPFTFAATAEAIVMLKAVPVFVDIEPDTYNMDWRQIEKVISKKTKAIIPVSLYGQPCDMDEINAIADKHGLTVIEDAAQSFGAEYKNKMSCNLSKMSCTSFFPAKPLGCYGDGGAVFTNDETLAKNLREIRAHGQKERYYHVRLGINARLDTLQCAILIEKLKRFSWEVEQRQKLAKRYDSALSGISKKLVTPVVREDRTTVVAQYTVRATERTQFIEKLAKLGVPTSVHYPRPIYAQPAFEEFRGRLPMPHTELAAQQVVSLPFYADMPEAIQDRVIEAVKKSI